MKERQKERSTHDRHPLACYPGAMTTRNPGPGELIGPGFRGSSLPGIKLLSMNWCYEFSRRKARRI